MMHLQESVFKINVCLLLQFLKKSVPGNNAGFQDGHLIRNAFEIGCDVGGKQDGSFIRFGQVDDHLQNAVVPVGRDLQPAHPE